MGVSTVLLLISIGVCAGIMSGLIGVGGGIVIVPALVFIMGFTQHEAQGLSIATMLPPIGIMAFYSYWQHGEITKLSIGYAAIIATTFVIGGFIGSKVALKISPNLIKLLFGMFMLIVAFKMIISGMAFFSENDD
jgi:uncharacterized membrane protein YfcA